MVGPNTVPPVVVRVTHVQRLADPVIARRVELDAHSEDLLEGNSQRLPSRVHDCSVAPGIHLPITRNRPAVDVTCIPCSKLS